MNIKRRLTGAAAVLLACIAALVFAALVPARAIPPSGTERYIIASCLTEKEIWNKYPKQAKLYAAG